MGTGFDGIGLEIRALWHSESRRSHRTQTPEIESNLGGRYTEVGASSLSHCSIILETGKVSISALAGGGVCIPRQSTSSAIEEKDGL